MAKVKYLNRLPKDWQTTARDLASKGATIIEIVASFGLPMSEHDSLYESNETYRREADTWRTMSEAHYVCLGRENLNNKNFRYKEWLISMRELFGWEIEDSKPKTGRLSKKTVDDNRGKSVLKNQVVDMNRYQKNTPEVNNG